jgi:hypothetical protein
MKNTILAMLVLVGGGCATVSPAVKQARQDREAACATMCAQVLPEMSLSKDDGNGLCRCWAMGSPEGVSPGAIASIRYSTPMLVAGR